VPEQEVWRWNVRRQDCKLREWKRKGFKNYPNVWDKEKKKMSVKEWGN